MKLNHILKEIRSGFIYPANHKLDVIKRSNKLSVVLGEEYNSKIIVYKGVSKTTGLMNWPVRTVGGVGYHIPGFMSVYDIAVVYSEPSLTGSDDQHSMIVKVELDSKEVENRSEEYAEWCRDNNISKPDISVNLPEHWRNDKKIWTIVESGSGHSGVSCYGNASFVYSGIPVEYEVVKYYENQNEWEEDNMALLRSWQAGVKK
jgi:hypothetical protein